MQDQINNLKQQVDQLTQQVADLTTQIKENDDVSLATGDLNSVDVIRDIVHEDRDLTTATSTTIILGAGGGTFGVPKLYTGYLITRFKGNVVRVPYI